MAGAAGLCSDSTAERRGLAPTLGCPAAAAGVEECREAGRHPGTQVLRCVTILKHITRMMQFTTDPLFTVFYQSHLETAAETGEAAAVR